MACCCDLAILVVRYSFSARKQNHKHTTIRKCMTATILNRTSCCLVVDHPSSRCEAVNMMQVQNSVSITDEDGASKNESTKKPDSAMGHDLEDEIKVFLQQCKSTSGPTQQKERKHTIANASRRTTTTRTKASSCNSIMDIFRVERKTEDEP